MGETAAGGEPLAFIIIASGEQSVESLGQLVAALDGPLHLYVFFFIVIDTRARTHTHAHTHTSIHTLHTTPILKFD